MVQIANIHILLIIRALAGMMFNKFIISVEKLNMRDGII